jgi:signal transduction histidine kinase
VLRFVRLEESRTAPGSGLGLSLVQAVADLHGAALEFSDAPGRGTDENPGLKAAIVLQSAA